MDNDYETQRHYINYDFCMLGLPIDDEDDVGADQEALLSRNAAAPINLAGDGKNGGAGASAGDAGTDNENVITGTKGRLPSTSDVWNDFDKIYKVLDGKNIHF